MKLSVHDLNSHYGPAHILFDVALEVGEGEVVALLGRNGAGKSTTFRSIVGLVAQRSGRIVFEGKDVSDQPTHAIVSRGLKESSVGKALFFHARYVSPRWRLKRVASIGNHIFYR